MKVCAESSNLYYAMLYIAKFLSVKNSYQLEVLRSDFYKIFSYIRSYISSYYLELVDYIPSICLKYALF